ncbi:MAG: DUF2608 domain-containing protein [Candidatus Algichlamydia australiensis]|nr:DUF2608 domain-containing protein [Chlamydiales bacterium]
MRLGIKFFLLLPLVLFGKVIEVQHFKELLTHISKDTLILLDIDDTLLIPKQMLGSDIWFNYRWREYQKMGMSRGDALEKSLAEWNAIRHLTEMEIVEPGTKEIISQMQDEGYTVMGLTTQGIAMATRTSMQLKDLGIHLVRTAPSKNGHYLNINEHGVLFREGVLFTSGTPKGKALFALLYTLGYYPKEIVFINDKLAHLHDIEEEAEKNKIKYCGLRYAYSDARKKAFRVDVADYQFCHSTFDRICSDEEGTIATNKSL